MSKVATRLYTAGEASAVSGLTVKAVNNAIDKGIIWIERNRVSPTRVKSVRRLSVDHLVRLKLWHALGGILSKDRRERLFAKVSERPNDRLLKLDEFLFVDVATARKEVAAKLGELAEAEAAVERRASLMKGEPVFKGTRIPVRLIAGMLKDGVKEDTILEGYPKLDRRLLSLATIWVAAHPARGRPKQLKDKGFAVLSTKRVKLSATALLGSPAAALTVHSTTHMTYDSMGRVACQAIRMDASQWATQSNPCLPQVTGAFGADRVTRTYYDLSGRVVQIRKAFGTSLEQAYVTYGYDQNDRRTVVVDANGGRAEFVYDGYGRPVRWNLPSATALTPAQLASFTAASPSNALALSGAVNASDSEQYGYDAAGNRTSLRKRDGVTITYQYDALNRMITKIVPMSVSGAAGYSVYYGYDLRGLQLFARFGSVNGQGITNSYDGQGRVVSTTTTMGGQARTISFQYDSQGNRTRITHPDAVRFDTTFDLGNRPISASWSDVTGATTNFLLTSYDNFGRKVGQQLGPGPSARTTTTIGYDPIGRLANYSHGFVNGVGNLATTLGYNPASQITTESRSNSDYVWTPIQDTSRTYTANGLNQYAQVGSVTYGYDANGNLNSDGSVAYVYDAENRLVSASASGGTTLAYDPLGRLWQTSAPVLGTTQFVYEGDHVAVEYDGAGAMKRRFFWGPGADEPIVQDDGGQLNCSGTRFFHLNHQDSTIAVTDCSGNRVAVNRYDEYGIPQTGNWGRFQYTGQAWLPELGMYYYKARIYSPILGRFLQTDPIGYDDQVNLYSYLANDPLNKTDPSGMAPGDRYKTRDQAASAAVRDINDTSKRQDREYAGRIYQNRDGTYSYTPPNAGNAHKSVAGSPPEAAPEFPGQDLTLM